MDRKSTLPSFEVHRPFGWGILLIGDAESFDIPHDAGSEIVMSTATNICVGVRHAQDVELPSDESLEVPPFEVRVHCQPGVSPRLGVSFDGVINLPSGRLSIGDADDEKILSLQPGPWRIQIEVDPQDHPERVHLWYSPDQAAAG